jgi:hypothetical protein
VYKRSGARQEEVKVSCARGAEERKEEEEKKKKKQFSLLRAANVHKTCIQSVHNIIMAGGEGKGPRFPVTFFEPLTE